MAPVANRAWETCEVHTIPQAVRARCHHTCGAGPLLTQLLRHMGAPSFIIPLAVAGIAYLFAVREFFSTATFPRHVIVVGLVLAAFVASFLFLMKNFAGFR